MDEFRRAQRKRDFARAMVVAALMIAIVACYNATFKEDEAEHQAQAKTAAMERILQRSADVVIALAMQKEAQKRAEREVQP